ncbi:MAG TPA: substrate-binding domain-containing protein [Rhizomicrobium sp.]|nr:substrate-binding domain-containing protein [Rhizomicrobium sp.]
MQKLNRNLLATACLALLGTAGMATGANAGTCFGDTNCSLGANPYVFGPNDIFAGGSSLIAPYWRQTDDCYGLPADLITKGTPPTFVDEQLVDTEGQNCANTHIDNTDTSWYISTGSGSGILGVFSHDPVSFWGEVNTNGPQYFPEVYFANSDAGLGTTDIDAYNNGSNSYCQGSTCIDIAAPGGLSSCNGEQNGVYPNPLQCYGPEVQFPLSIDPVAIIYTNGGIYEKTYNPSSKKEIDYSFNIVKATKYGGLRLSVGSLCGIYNGQITNWNDPSLTADNGGVSLADPNDPTYQQTGTFNVNLIPVARSDSSGTTSITTRHLANVCAGYGYNLYTTGATTISAAGANSIVGNTYNVNNPNYPGVDQPGKITLAPNSAGVAQYVAFTQSPAGEGAQCSSGTQVESGYTDCIQQGRVGYDGGDYVEPYVKESQTNTYGLFSAALQNEQGQWETVSPKGAEIAFADIQPPQTSSKGKYCASCTNFGYRDNQLDWVEGLNPAEPLANPSASNAYPLVGTTQMEAYTCYANADALAVLTGEITYQETSKVTTNKKKGILGAAGLSPLPKAWADAIEDAFVKNTDKLNLELSSVSNGKSSNPNCDGTSGA